jgi:hypothetical protein
LGITATTDDVLLQRLIDGASSFVYNYLSLDTFAKSQYDEMYNGTGGALLVLRQMPPIEVLAVAVNGSPIAPAMGDGKTSPFTNGYKLFRQNLTLFGLMFPHQRDSVYVSYLAGYEIEDEAHTVPSADHKVTVDQTWLDDQGVTLANGTPLTKVASGPAALQYSVTDGVYTFNTAQDNAGVLISYSYVPADINQAVVELVAERYKYRDRIGHTNKSLGGQETVGFQANNVPQFILALLNKYIQGGTGLVLMNVTLVGDKELIARLQKMPGAVQAALKIKVTQLALQLENYVKTRKLNGQVLNRITGRLARSIANKVTATRRRSSPASSRPATLSMPVSMSSGARPRRTSSNPRRRRCWRSRWAAKCALPAG